MTHSKYNYLLSAIGFAILILIIMADTKKETLTPPPPTTNDKGKTKATKHVISRQTVSTFKGASPALSGKVFISGPSQALKYDEAYKALIHYFNVKYDHRVSRAFETKDPSLGLSLLIRPTPPKITKVVQVPTLGSSSIMEGVEREVIDRDSDTFFEYQEEMKRYVSDKAKYLKDMQDCFDIIMGQCSPAVEQNLESEDTFAEIKRKSDSIGLIKLLESLCYNFKPHEYTPLGAWTALDKLTALVQPETVHEVKHYETYKSVIEMCKASKVNFALLCTDNIDMSMNTLRNEGKITTTGTYANGDYFKLTDPE